MISAVIFSELLQPVGGRLIDTYLIEFDALLGFQWNHYVEVFEGHETLAWFLRIIYKASIYQLLFVIVVLAARQNHQALHMFLITGLIASLTTVLIWYFIPSVGPASIHNIDPDLEKKLNLIIGSETGESILKAASELADTISPDYRRALIAFPSFHVAMVFLSCWFLSEYRPIQITLILLNIPMFPAALLHGTHYLVDLPAGAAVFLISCQLAKEVYDHPFIGAGGTSRKQPADSSETPCANDPDWFAIRGDEKKTIETEGDRS